LMVHLPVPYSPDSMALYYIILAPHWPASHFTHSPSCINPSRACRTEFTAALTESTSVPDSADTDGVTD
jgi:hypothetical protein